MSKVNTSSSESLRMVQVKECDSIRSKMKNKMQTKPLLESIHVTIKKSVV